MEFRTDVFDVWVYRRDADAVRYLLLHTSQEKADRWFNGGRFWQIPSDFVAANESLDQAARRCLSDYNIAAESLWAVEHSYTIFNRRFQNVQLILVLAGEVRGDCVVRLSWEHAEHRWCTAAECEALIAFRGLKEGLQWTRRYVTEADRVLPELRLS